VLGDQAGDPSGVGNGETQPYRCAVIENIEDKAIQPQLVDELLHHGCQVVEGIFESVVWGCVGEPEAGEVGRDHAIGGAEYRDQVTEHKGGGRVAVQQKHYRPGRRTGLAVKDGETLDADVLEDDGGVGHRTCFL